MSRNLSLHIGVNIVDQKSYGSTHYKNLRSCLYDAWDMRDLAHRKEYDVMAVLENSQATFEAVEDYIYSAVAALKYGGTFLLTFSGHGAKIGGIEREDGYDEGFVLHDLVFKDNYLGVVLRMLNPGTRFIIVADCCHSETIYGINRPQARVAGKEDRNSINKEEWKRNKRLGRKAAIQHQSIQREKYEILDKWYRNELAHTHGVIMADGIMLSACRDNEQALDGPRNGVFTHMLLNTLRNGGNPPGTPFKGTYQELITAIRSGMTPEQQPQCTRLGPYAGCYGYPFFQGPPFEIIY